MESIQLLYVKNIISRREGNVRQEVAFALLVENRAYEKHVEVRWAGEDNNWRTLPAHYRYETGGGKEVWVAQTSIPLVERQSLPGNIQFRCHCTMDGQSDTLDNDGQSFRLEADAGIGVAEAYPILLIDHDPHLGRRQKSVTVTVATRGSRQPRRVYVRWSTDNWQSYRETTCITRRTHWNKTEKSNARNPNQYDCQIWTAQIKINNAYRVQFAAACEMADQTVWDSNLGDDYVAHRGRFKVMTLNLHCYQEADQQEKFRQIARAIQKLDVDVICLQEVCEQWNDGRGDWNSNAAKIINDHLNNRYHLHTDWSHIGFDHYREGIAVLSKYPFQKKDAGYISGSKDQHSIHARKVVMTQIRVPYLGQVNVFSAHLSWWEDGFAEQFHNLRHWADQKHNRQVAATLLCGDFNIKAGSRGYRLVVDDSDFEDQYLKIVDRPIFDNVYRRPSPDWQQLDHDGRIDYIFLKKGSPLKAVAAQELFTEKDYGRVSDHLAYLTEFEPY